MLMGGSGTAIDKVVANQGRSGKNLSATFPSILT